MELVLNEAIRAEEGCFVVDRAQLAKDAVWQTREGETSRTLVYKGKPIVEMFPLEMKVEGEKVVFTQKYRKLSGQDQV